MARPSLPTPCCRANPELTRSRPVLAAANLASFFTRPSFDLHGPKSMKEAKEKIACVILEALEWQVERLRTLFTEFAGPAAAPPADEAADSSEG